ncbi:MAG: enoyl-CoA hydratase [Deinococcus sp.]|uniref:enoyl-CoA hydratase n=1 Tax=Deinococcus sp. TaxID=47478 RepID=UPI0026DB3140|nr:enoyl-CoA hydratase [Deinococcus sp.]MDO4245661.1 enoyl-CoA hydratase [Deinococcus sp.]
MNDILCSTENGVMTLTINRPDKKNSLTLAMYKALADHLEQAQADAEVRVVVLQGHPQIFSAGNDIADFLSLSGSVQDSPITRFLRTVATFPKPLVAAVSGAAVGIGTTMLLHCDLVYASDTALFSLPFVDLGLCPEAASSLLLPQRLGHQRASAALLLGEPLSAQAALDAGLVNAVVPTEEVTALAQAQAQKLAAKPLGAVLETKRLIKEGQQQAVLTHMGAEEAVFGRLLREPAAREAFTAFLEKRRPDFRGL